MSDFVERFTEYLAEICESIHICPECGATIQGRDIPVKRLVIDPVSGSVCYEHCPKSYTEVIKPPSPK